MGVGTSPAAFRASVETRLKKEIAPARGRDLNRLRVQDFLVFAIAPDPTHPTITGDGQKYDGVRFKVKATLAGKPYADFGLDVAYGDPILGEPDLLEGSTFFEKYGIPLQLPGQSSRPGQAATPAT